MKPLLAAATALALSASSAPVLAAVTLGPAVTPHGPGHVVLAWEADGSAPMTVTLTSTGRAPRTLTSQPDGDFHRVVAAWLEPGVEYEYTVGERHGRFVAPPDRAQDVRFAVFGDTRTGDAVHRQVVARIASERPDFYLTTGDAVPDGSSKDQWHDYFEIERPLLTTAAVTGARGNHDGDGTTLAKLMPVGSETPGAGETYGSMDLGPAHVVLIDSEQPATPGTA
jgi:hypothetical protein